MGLIKKIDVPRHFAARQALRLAASRMARFNDGTRVSATPPAGMRGSGERYLETSSPEHSTLSLPGLPKE
jgi:hypothetical protein